MGNSWGAGQDIGNGEWGALLGENGWLEIPFMRKGTLEHVVIDPTCLYPVSEHGSVFMWLNTETGSEQEADET